MNKLKMHSPDLTQANIDKLAQLFPNCVAEACGVDGVLKRSIDFDQLRQELSTSLVEGPQERYQLNWPGKREALLTANAPIAKTLRPCLEESVNFDTTQNLFIEGDNLDALKLLQETYLNKVKMIYIDPPYNTGNDFIYEDDFAENIDGYFERSNQKDVTGNRMVANTEGNGRFHSDWLSMMYSRLKLARNLLRENGVIFISIDDNEQSNLKRICDEVFGELSYIATIAWQNSSRQNDLIAIEHEYILVYGRNKAANGSKWNKSREIANKLKSLISKLRDEGKTIEQAQKNLCFEIDCLQQEDVHKGTKEYSWLGNYRTIDESWNIYYAVDLSGEGTGPSRKFGDREIPAPIGRHWMGQEYIDQLFEGQRIVWRGDRAYRKLYIQESFDNLKSVIRMPTRNGSETLKKLLGKDIFDKPKPHNLIKHLAYYALEKDDLVLDFFSGSATTAHAMMELNAEDGGKRKYILVQLPESCEEDSKAFDAGFKTITDIGKERIRRAGKKIKRDYASSSSIGKLDIGFRVLKIDSSNMKEVFYTPDTISQDLLSDQVNNIREDRTSEDLLFQVLLDWGVDLALPITQETIAGKAVFFVDGNALAACFEEGVSEEFVKLLAKRVPLRAVFRDSGFANDSVKINVEQIFKLMSPGTEVKCI